MTVLVGAKSYTGDPGLVRRGRSLEPATSGSTSSAADALRTPGAAPAQGGVALSGSRSRGGLAQADVWNEVRDKSAPHGASARQRARTPTSPIATHENELCELERAFPILPGQCGAVLALGDDLRLDDVSRPAALCASLPQAARRATCSTGSSELDPEAGRPERLARFVESVGSATRQARGARPDSARTCGCTGGRRRRLGPRARG